MRRAMITFVVGLTLFVTTPVMASDERYKAMPLTIKEGLSGVLIIDTKEGHLWMWVWEADWSYLIYQGQVRPGEKPEDVIFSGNMNRAFKKALSRDYHFLIKQAKKAEKEESFSEAIDLVKKARKIRINDENTNYLATLLSKYGLVLAEEKDYERAISLYTESNRIRSDPKTYLNMAIAYDFLGNEKKALETLEKAYVLRPKNVRIQRDILTFWARLQERKENYEKAMNLYKESIKVYPRDRETLISLGLLFFNQKDYDKALDYLQKAAALSPRKNELDNAKIYRLIGEIYRRLGRVSKNNDEKIKQ